MKNSDKCEVHYEKDFTVITNSIFRDSSISLRAKGLLCTALSLPKDWDYTIYGLFTIVNPRQESHYSNGKTYKKVCPLKGQSLYSIKEILNELEEAGYLIRQQLRTNGKFAGNCWHFFDTPQDQPLEAALQDPEIDAVAVINIVDDVALADPDSAPLADLPLAETPLAADRTQYNTKEIKNESHPSSPEPVAPTAEVGELSEEKKNGFDDLLAKSLKTVHKSSYQETLVAYLIRLDEGYTPEQISKAYDSYISSYRERNGSDIRFAKQLVNWLKEPSGFLLLAGKPGGSKDRYVRSRTAKEHDQIVQDSLREQKINEYLLNTDDTYKDLRTQHADLLRDMAIALNTGNHEEISAITSKISEISDQMAQIRLDKQAEWQEALSL